MKLKITKYERKILLAMFEDSGQLTVDPPTRALWVKILRGKK